MFFWLVLYVLTPISGIEYDVHELKDTIFSWDPSKTCMSPSMSSNNYDKRCMEMYLTCLLKDWYHSLYLHWYHTSYMQIVFTWTYHWRSKQTIKDRFIYFHLILLLSLYKILMISHQFVLKFYTIFYYIYKKNMNVWITYNYCKSSNKWCIILT